MPKKLRTRLDSFPYSISNRCRKNGRPLLPLDLPKGIKLREDESDEELRYFDRFGFNLWLWDNGLNLGVLRDFTGNLPAKYDDALRLDHVTLHKKAYRKKFEMLYCDEGPL